MKIIGGKLKGRNFFMPKTVRATPSIVRKAVFDILGQNLEGVSLIDLFAGSGSVGLEAISRGAGRVIMVEKDIRSAEIIRENLATLGILPEGSFDFTHRPINMDVFQCMKGLNAKGERFDIVFADPPYYRGLAKKTLKTLCAYDIVQPNCIIILQHEKREALPDTEGRFFLVRQKKYGTSFLTVYQEKKT